MKQGRHRARGQLGKGTEIKSVEVVMFMRAVKSRAFLHVDEMPRGGWRVKLLAVGGVPHD